MICRKWLLFFVIFICDLSSAADLFVNDLPRKFMLADKVELDATIGGYPIWQGEGKWRIVDLIRSNSTGGAASVPLGIAYFFQTEGDKWVASMEVESNLRRGNGYWIGDPCKRDDMLFKLSLGGGVKDNCVTINHITQYMGNPGGKNTELYALLKDKGIEIPPTVLQIKLTRNATDLRMLKYTLWINPELAGFSREYESSWGRNPWNKVMSFKDPEKKKYIDALSKWATNFVNKMEDGIRQKPDAFVDIPSWRTVQDGYPKENQVKTNITLD
jgi:hypothetical protein